MTDDPIADAIAALKPWAELADAFGAAVGSAAPLIVGTAWDEKHDNLEEGEDYAENKFMQYASDELKQQYAEK